ncbi:fluoride efflux transporter FluC [Paractinoplanes lichenicola]|uniref:fluoride efflux transporter FluC n=1 Tax=Paractinoplanes lichenicola TaxID=2802976 RepID=UPI0027DAF64B|nr:CrcB family protein [Actinoplanes lichenicola]
MPDRSQAQIIAAVALGGILGACARYGAALLWPTAPDGFPWTTFWVNVTGCAAMGVLMVVITEVLTAHPLVRPFLGTGILGGYTTFSTYIVDAQHLLDTGHAATALTYLATTLLAALFAVQVAASLTRKLAPTLRHRREGARP